MDKLFLYDKDGCRHNKPRSEIVRMQAEDGASRVYFTDGTSAVVHAPLGECYQRVKDCPAFIQVHRAHVININHMAWIEEDGATIIMNDEESTPVPLSESGKLLLEATPMFC